MAHQTGQPSIELVFFVEGREVTRFSGSAVPRVGENVTVADHSGEDASKGYVCEGVVEAVSWMFMTERDPGVHRVARARIDIRPQSL